MNKYLKLLGMFAVYLLFLCLYGRWITNDANEASIDGTLSYLLISVIGEIAFVSCLLIYAIKDIREIKRNKGKAKSASSRPEEE